jgi:hypothetical protein
MKTLMSAQGLCGFGRRGRRRARSAVLVTTVLGAWLLAGVVPMARAGSLVLERRIDLPSVRGRLDHMAVDLEGQRLFVSALASDSVEVIDLREGKRVDRITSLHEPQGGLYLARLRRLLVANGNGGGVQAFSNGKSSATASQPSLDDADNLRLDPINGDVYVGAGNELVALDPDTLRIRKRINLAGHPEAFQLEPSGRKIYSTCPLQIMSPWSIATPARSRRPGKSRMQPATLRRRWMKSHTSYSS